MRRIIDPDPSTVEYAWINPRSRERKALDHFLWLARNKIDHAGVPGTVPGDSVPGDPDPLPFPAEEGRRVLDWLERRLKLRSPLGGGGYVP
jgi:hypothetical protein